MKEKMTDEECISNNICPHCYGKKEFDGHKDRKIQCVCEDGTYVGFLLKFKIPMLDISINRTKEEYKKIQDWAKKTSKCEKCGGDQWKTFGLMICDECGIPGLQYWPG